MAESAMNPKLARGPKHLCLAPKILDTNSTHEPTLILCLYSSLNSLCRTVLFLKKIIGCTCITSCELV